MSAQDEPVAVDALPADSALRLSSKRGRWVIAVTVLGSSMVFLDGTVVNIALPAIGRDLGAGIAGLQWTVNGYLLTLAALIILGGSMGDRYGRRKIFVIGTVGFVASSVLCGLAPSEEFLIAARVLQGIGGALLTPGSLAIIEATFHREDRGRAIGLWSGLAGVSTAAGPALGGYLIDAVSWRAIFFLNVPVGLLVLFEAARHVPETKGSVMARGLDFSGAALAAIGLGCVSAALIEGPIYGALSAAAIALAVAGVVTLGLFGYVETHKEEPMLPFGIFRSKAFSAANIVTFVVYAALGGVFFFVSVFLQTALKYSPLDAGISGLPVTALMLLFSARAGALAQKIGARPLLTIGPLVMAAAMFLFRGLSPGDSYVSGVLPGMIVFGIGLACVVAPVTSTALSSAPSDHAGLASAVNNAVSRTGQLIAIALLPAVAGLTGDAYENPAAITSAFHNAMLATAALAILGAVAAWTMVGPDVLKVLPGDRAVSDS